MLNESPGANAEPCKKIGARVAAFRFTGSADRFGMTSGKFGR